MALAKKTHGRANSKYFESSEVISTLDTVRQWLQKNPSTKKVSVEQDGRAAAELTQPARRRLRAG